MQNLTRRDFGLCLGAAAALSVACESIAAEPAGIDITPYLHPEYRPFLPTFEQMSRRAPASAAGLATQRSAFPPPPPAASPAITERRIPGRAGAPDVQIFIVNAGEKPGGPRPAIVNMHGGGFIALSARHDLPNLQRLAADLDCVIVAVEYRLAPETPFPGSLEDNYAALLWLYRNAESLGADRNRIAVMGGSAGGGHAAMLAIAARDRGEVPVVFQALTYPMLDDRTGSIRKTPPYIGTLVWTAADNPFGWSSLLGMPAGSKRVPYGSVPARVENLKGLPPAFIGVGTLDLFVDEDIDYARRLVAAGVPTDLYVVRGVPHVFEMFPTKVAAQYREVFLNSLRVGLAPRG